MEKIEIQSHVKGQAEEFAVRTQIFEQEIVNIKKHREIEIEEMDNRLQKVNGVTSNYAECFDCMFPNMKPEFMWFGFFLYRNMSPNWRTISNNCVKNLKGKLRQGEKPKKICSMLKRMT